jgi:polyisoprenoid-binding protein YceI
MDMIRATAIALSLLAAAPVSAQQTPLNIAGGDAGIYTLDSEMVSMTMTVRRALMSPVQAEFGTVAGTLTIAPDRPSEVHVTIAATDMTANGPMVERLLKGEDFLNVTMFPDIAFHAEAFEISREPAPLEGVLTMAGISHPASFTAQLVNQTQHDGGARLEFMVEGTLERANWGMTGYRGFVSGTVRIRIDAAFDAGSEAMIAD